MTAPSLTVIKGQWFLMPSGKTVEVCRVECCEVVRLDARGRRMTVEEHEVVLRYLNNDGAMAPGEFLLALDFLLKHGKHVDVTPAVAL